jgi:hypothetical protein
MVRLTLVLLAATCAGACQSDSSARASSELLLIALKSAHAVASTDCDLPRTSFRPDGGSGAGRVSPAGLRLTAVAVVYRRNAPRHPHAVVGTVSASVPRDSACVTDLVAVIRDRAAAEGCDAIVVGEEAAMAAGGRTSLEGSCLVFSR